MTCASEQGGTTTVSALCCFGISTSRTPGFCSATETASDEELEDELPQAVSPSATAAAATLPNARRIAVDLPTVAMTPPSARSRFGLL